MISYQDEYRKTSHRQVWSQEDVEYLMRTYSKDGRNIKELVKVLGKSKKAIYHKASRLGIKSGRPAHNRSKKPRRDWDNEYYRKNKTTIVRNRRLRIKRLKKKLVDLLGGECKFCGYNRCMQALDFHHVNGTKEASVGTLIADECTKAAYKEVKSCILLCSNCHRELHHNPKLLNTSENI